MGYEIGWTMSRDGNNPVCHDVAMDSESFAAIMFGPKRFESIPTEDGDDYRVNDILVIKEVTISGSWMNIIHTFTGRKCRCKIAYVDHPVTGITILGFIPQGSYPPLKYDFA